MSASIARSGLNVCEIDADHERRHVPRRVSHSTIRHEWRSRVSRDDEITFDTKLGQVGPQDLSRYSWSDDMSQMLKYRRAWPLTGGLD